MKTWKLIKQISVIAGLAVGFWLSAHNGATDLDQIVALFIIVQSMLLGLSMHITVKREK